MNKRLCAVLMILFLPSCVAVQPWERGEFAKAEMGFDADPLESKIRNHIYFSKEASSSGSSSSGSGCGCN